jgi:hypothetical protein
MSDRTRDPRIDPRPGDIVQGFDKKQREVVQTWPRALAAERPATLKGAATTLPVGALVSRVSIADEGPPAFAVRIETPAGQAYYRVPAKVGDEIPLVDAPAGTPVVEVEYRSIGEPYSHLVALQTVRLGMWRGWARGTVIRTGPG